MTETSVEWWCFYEWFSSVVAIQINPNKYTHKLQFLNFNNIFILLKKKEEKKAITVR
jgi:hypothetical protein